jgi:hypothetical protein
MVLAAYGKERSTGIKRKSQAYDEHMALLQLQNYLASVESFLLSTFA